MVQCERCSATFDPYREWQRFCSAECKRAWEANGGRLIDALADLPEDQLRDVLRRAMRKRDGTGRLRVRF